MTTGSITVTDQASGAEVASRTISEDALTKHIQRVQLDGRLNSPAKRYQISVSLPASATAGTNLGGLRNPTGGTDKYIHNITVRQYQAAASTASAPIGLKRATSVAGGTLIAAADVPKLDPDAANAALEVRTGAVTGAKAAQYIEVFQSTPTLAAGGGGGDSVFDSHNDLARAIRLKADDGLIFDQESIADADVRYKVTIEWEEA